MAWNAATGITSGTHRPNPTSCPADRRRAAGGDRDPVGPVAPVTPYDFAFEVDDNPANYTMTRHDRRRPRRRLHPAAPLRRRRRGGRADRGHRLRAASAPPETAIVTQPEARPLGRAHRRLRGLRHRVRHGRVRGPERLRRQGHRRHLVERDRGAHRLGLHQHPHRRRPRACRTAPTPAATTRSPLDIVNLADGDRRVARASPVPRRASSTAGRARSPPARSNAFEVPIFNNGSDGAASASTSRSTRARPTGPLVDVRHRERRRRSTSAVFEFDFDPGHEGHYDLYTIVDPGDDIDEAIEDNNVQKSSGWAGPRRDPATRCSSSTTTAPATPSRPTPARWPRWASRTPSSRSTSPPRRCAPTTRSSGWAPSTATSGQLDEDDRAEIAAYLDGGGKLWLSSNRAIEALGLTEGAEFGASYFGVDVGRHRLLLQDRPVRDGGHPPATRPSTSTCSPAGPSSTSTTWPAPRRASPRCSATSPASACSRARAPPPRPATARRSSALASRATASTAASRPS